MIYSNFVINMITLMVVVQALEVSLAVDAAVTPTHQPSVEPTLHCFDPDRVDPDRICSLIFKPVCGCNGITYSNECFADMEGTYMM
jgi:hypothetical protein